LIRNSEIHEQYESDQKDQLINKLKDVIKKYANSEK
jgi:hypothetical protein